MSDKRASRLVSLGVARLTATAAAAAAATESAAEVVAMLHDLERQSLARVALEEAKIEERKCAGRSAATSRGQTQQLGAAPSIKKRRTLRTPRTAAAASVRLQV